MDYHRLTSKAVFRYLTWPISYSMKQTKHLYILASTNAWNQTHFLLLSPLARFREILQDFVRIPILLCEHAAKAVFVRVASLAMSSWNPASIFSAASVSPSRWTARSVCGMVRAVSAMMNAFRRRFLIVQGRDRLLFAWLGRGGLRPCNRSRGPRRWAGRRSCWVDR